ncbi:sperm axonemal maintenance protein CFAP97D1 isoform X2 [Pseudorasbora parva]|uniref:sperm axonemal maintenance protein CFAP97D1 isoform X2 n=1 Tax=Pseudorasbora parva TaxID=51549 RepID=UPI00351EEA81
MHRSYQPLTPATNRFLQRRWDLTRYEDHRGKLQEERMSIIERDNHRLASRLAAISRSQGLVDHRNHYSQYSLNAQTRKEKLLQVTHENQEIYQRIITQKSDYRRDLWEDDWEKAKRWRDDIARYPRGEASKQKPLKGVQFSGGTLGRSQRSSSGVEEDGEETTEEEPQPAT